jgi:magnesium-protoporphyrin IX monomethyl ester (oxidative) cyclase
MKVLLINPPATVPVDWKTRVGICPPLGLAYLAASLLRAGHEVKILDALAEAGDGWLAHTPGKLMRWGMMDWQISARIRKFAPDMVGVTCPFSAREVDAINVCRLAKEVNPAIVTVVGGAHPTCAPERFLRSQYVDRVVLGEGEEAILAVCGSPGGRGTIRAQRVAALDTLPLPARHLLPMDRYLWTRSPHSGYKQRPFTSIITSRGCPNRCTFCVIRQIWGPRVRYRSPESVLAEIDRLVDKYGVKEVHFEDDNVSANRGRFHGLLRGIREARHGLSLASPSGLAANTLDADTLQLMCDAGFYSISLAVESGVERTLELMRKPVNLKEVPNVVTTAQELGMRVKAFFMLGYPGESRADIDRTVEFADGLGLDWAIFFPVSAIPGSALERDCRKRGWLDEDADPQRLFYRPNIRTPEFRPDDVERWVAEAHERVNGKSRWTEQLEQVVANYPHLAWAKEALNNAREKKEA